MWQLTHSGGPVADHSEGEGAVPDATAVEGAGEGEVQLVLGHRHAAQGQVTHALPEQHRWSSSRCPRLFRPLLGRV